jgi:tetratricopeptide (TPR) repeat protein
MAVAADSTVLGDFSDAEFTHHDQTSRFYRRDGRYFVWTEGPGGEPGEFEITHTFGYKPLQQYLVPFAGGRLQALNLAWDADQNRWFTLNPDREIPPDDWLHWTRNAQNWNGMCAECHSTNLRKGYDPETDSYQTTWSDIDVGCEACHGPGSLHVAWASLPPMARGQLTNTGLPVPTSDISARRLVELCAPCHSRRAELGDYDHTGLHLLDHMLPSLLEEGLYHPDGQILDEVYVYGSFLQSKMDARQVRCSDCHDSHSLQLHFEGNELCLQCHQREVYDTADHHFHKKVHEGRPSPGALCVKCHMVEQPYMVIDWRADHSFRVPRPDLSAEIGTPNACTQIGCHDNKPLSYSLDAYRKWYGEARKPHFGTSFAAARAGSPTATAELVRLVKNPLQPVIVRATALALLATQPDQAATEAIEAALQADEPLLRRTGTVYLREADPSRRSALLAPLLADSLKAVRLAAAAELAGTPEDFLKDYQRAALDQALSEYRQAMAYALDFASAGLNLGNLGAQLGDSAGAERYYRLALGIDDLFLPAAMNLAVLLSGQGRSAEAEPILRKVAVAYPDNGDIAYSLGLLLVELQQPQEALAWLERAVNARPEHARAHYNFGLLLGQAGRLGQSETELRRALELAPDNLDFLHGVADILIRTGRPQDALPLAERMIATHPEAPLGREMKDYLTRLLGAD